MSNQISSKTEKVKKVHCNFKKVTDSKQLIISEAIKWFEAMISKITFLVQSGKYEFFELILQCYILETLSLSQFQVDWNKSNCSENLPNSKIYFFLLVLAAVAPLSVNIIASASTTTVPISSASCHPSRNPLFRKKQVTPVIFLSEGDGSRSFLAANSARISRFRWPYPAATVKKRHRRASTNHFSRRSEGIHSPNSSSSIQVVVTGLGDHNPGKRLAIGR